MSKYYAKWGSGFEVWWRNLTWTEYKTFKSRLDGSSFDEPMDIALDIYKSIYIEGPDPVYVPAGIPAYILKQQMLDNPFSGKFKDISEAINLGRRYVTGDYLLSVKGLIAATLNYKPEEIDQWDPNKFFVRLAQTELALGRTFDPVDPKAPKTKPGQLPKPKVPLTSAQSRALDRVKQRDG